MSEPEVGQIWKLRSNGTHVFITKVMPRYIGPHKTGYDVRYKSLKMLDDTGSTVLDAQSFKEHFQLVSG